MPKPNRVAVSVVTIVAGNGAGQWSDPDAVDGVQPAQVELAYAPTFWWHQRVNSFAPNAQGELTVTVTKQGCNVVSSNPGDAALVRVYAVCRAGDLGA